MPKFLNKFTPLLLLFFITFCDGQNSMDKSILKKKNTHQIDLSKKLKEVSGIAFTKDGRLFAHDDERAVIYQINPLNGSIIKSFYFGMLVKRADFEDIEIVNNDFYMVASNGVIYKFHEGKNAEQVDYEIFPTHLSKGNDVEGLCFDPETNSLLLALKGNPGSGFGKDKKAIYSFSLKNNKLDKNPRFILDKNELRRYSSDNDFAPSGIARNPKTGNFYVIAAKGNLMVEINRQGFVVAVTKLDTKKHYQPEGISFLDEKTLFICDEGKRKGSLTKYILD